MARKTPILGDAHRPRSFRRLMREMILLSYLSLVRALDRPVRFEVWAKTKIAYDSRLTRLVFGYFAAQHQRVFDPREFGTFYFLFRRHLTHRQKIYRVARRLPVGQSAAFVVLSFWDAYVTVLGRLGREALMLRDYPVVDFSGLPRIIDISIGFPDHAFALSPDDLRAALPHDTRVWFSFGDAMAEKGGAVTGLLSIRGYTRPSRAREGYNGRPGHNPEHLPMQQVIYRRNTCKALGPILATIGRTLRALVSGRALHDLERLRSDTRALRYRRVFAQVYKAGYRVGDIHCLPFDDIGSIRFRGFWSRKIVNVHYSQNTKLPPFEAPEDLLEDGVTRVEATPDRAFAGELPLYTYFLTGRSIGFTELNIEAHRSKTTLLTRFGLTQPVPDPAQPPRTPMLLGFERLGTTDFPALAADRPLVAVFDVPPQSVQDTLPRALIGDRSCTLDLIEQFLDQVATACIAADRRAVLKPKYSVTNSPSDYARLLRRIESDYPNHVTLLDPYANMAELLVHVRGAVSYPYTSTRFVAAATGRPSIYFFPEGPLAPLFAREGDFKTLTRQDSLVGFLRAL